LDTAEARYRPVPRERVLDGVIEAVNRSTVSAQISGRVVEIAFDVDDVVAEGAVIVRFDDREIRAEVERLEAELRSSAARLEQARREFERIDRLYRNQTVSRADFDRAEADHDAATAQLEASRAALAQARERLGYTVVRAPYGGIVTQRHIEIGEAASPGTPLMSGFSLERLRVEIDVPQRWIGEIRGASRTVVRLDDPDERTIAATGVTVFPYADRDSGTVRVRLDLPADVENLYPGMLVKALFETGSERRLMIPDGAVVYRSEVAGVYVVDSGGRVSFRHVRPGRANGSGEIEILSGLGEGEHVAVDPAAAVAVLIQAGRSRD
jgi:RND family efflux transporter MFP subunit